MEVRDVEVTDVVSLAGDDAGFCVTPTSGPVRARRLLLATGVRDTLPAVAGIEELFGSVVAHCPYCHGHEFAGKHVVILGSHGHVALVADLVERIAARRTVLTNGQHLDPDPSAILERSGVAWRCGPSRSRRSRAVTTVPWSRSPPGPTSRWAAS